MGTMDEHEACEVGRTTPISVARRMIGNPLVAVISYLSEHPGTVRHYDLQEALVSDPTHQGLSRCSERSTYSNRPQPALPD
jgi:hypothetical protein